MSQKETKISKESSHVQHIEPYSPQFSAMVPLGTQKFFRTCVLWQFIRFIAINIKMTILIVKSHH
jgi:hypothetical protein